LKNREIANLFEEIADILELRGENRFRINAYRRSAQAVSGISRDIEEMAAEGSIESIPGIGKDLREKIEEYLRSGEISLLERLKNETPPILLDMLRIPGIGPKTALLIHAELGVGSLEDLKRMALEHRLQELPKIKEKTEKNIIRGIEFLESFKGRTPIGIALPLAEDIIESLEGCEEVSRLEYAGSLRRHCETVGDIDILAASSSPEDTIKYFAGLSLVESVIVSGPTKCSVFTSDGIQVDLRVVEEKSYGAALNYFTGSKAHNIRLREIAIERNLKLNEYGVFEKKDGGSGKRIAGATEDEVYSALGLPYIPPEIREDTGEIEAALKGGLPELVSRSDIRGDLHTHSDWSDGNASLDDLASAGKRAGLKYILVSDHSMSLRIAHGLTAKRLISQIAEIDRINEKIRGFRLLKGSEVDILPDGSLDLEDGVLKKLDVVIAAVHSSFKMKRDRMTERIISAMKNPFVSVLAHPTGRLLGTREPYDVDMDAVIAAAAETETALEINSHPLRLDLDPVHARKAAAAGVLLSLGTDSHDPSLELDHLRYGIGTARRGWLCKEHILNSRTAAALKKLIERKRKRNP